MKIWYKFLFLPILILAFVGCSDDEQESVWVYHVENEDGKVTQLQKHTIGNGIPIIIMCDRYSDKSITDGYYRRATKKVLEGLFSVHPMKSLRDYFDVYEVTVVAYTYRISKKVVPVFTIQDLESILQSQDGDDKAVEYAKKAVGEERIDDAVVIILVNHDQYYRSCCLGVSPSSSSYSDIPTGGARAYVWDSSDGSESLSDYYGTLLHEFGHAFAKLADEYVEEDKAWNDYQWCKEMFMEEQKYGYWRNISFDSDVTKSYWADFAADSRYDFEKLGCYEGGFFQEKGVYRATKNSIMNDTFSTFYFNVISRVMIYKRCMRIAYGDSWKFEYEDFVKFDLEKAKAEYRADKERYHSYSYSKSKYLGVPPRFIKQKTSR